MEPTAIAKQVIDFQKTVFDNSFNTMVHFQEQTESRMNDAINQMPWATAEGKKAMQDANSLAKKVRNDFKNVVDDGYKRLGEIVTVS